MPDLEALRPRLYAIAYRMLGTASAAEEVVQEAYLTTLTTRIAIDQLRSARARRETYYGPWLPEPLVTAAGPDPAEVADMADSLSLSFLVLLETLTPVERAVFLLREVFDYEYDE